MAEHFENAIIGGGKAGKTLAMDLASHGQRTLMVERGMIGGTCINVACIPTKTMVRSAQVAELARRGAEFGIQGNFTVDLATVRRRKQAVVSGMVAANQKKFDQSGMTLLLGVARFTGPKAFSVKLNSGEEKSFTADKVFINTGTRPSMPELPGLAAAAALTSESIMELERLPQHLLVLGGGYIGLEFAQMFRRFGSQVTMIERSPQFLPREDADIAEQVRKILTEEGIEILTAAAAKSVEGKSGSSVKLLLQTATVEKSVAGTDLLVALGRVPTTEALNLAAAGVAVDGRGFVQVNDRLETSAPGVWALGDVNGGPQFTHASLDDYRIVKANLTGGHRSTKDRIMPYTLFIDPELGRAGLTEQEARQKGLEIKIARLPAAAIPRARTLGETKGVLKAVIDAKSERILGVSILAAEGGEIMAVLLTAMRAGLPYTALRDAIFAHPTMAESLNDLFAHPE